MQIGWLRVSFILAFAGGWTPRFNRNTDGPPLLDRRLFPLEQKYIYMCYICIHVRWGSHSVQVLSKLACAYPCVDWVPSGDNTLIHKLR